jgi:hypothetical protein
LPPLQTAWLTRVSSCLDRLCALAMAQMWKSVDGAAIVGTEFSLRRLEWERAITVSGQLTP